MRTIKQVLLLLILSIGSYSVYSQNIVVEEGFETWPPDGWTFTPETGNAAWGQDNAAGGPGTPYEGQYVAIYKLSNVGSNVGGSMTTPNMDLSGVQNPELSFYWWNSTPKNQYHRPFLEIYASENGTDFFLLERIITMEASSWNKYTRPLNNNVKKVKIYTMKNEYYHPHNVYIDKFVVKEGPVCASPVDLRYSLQATKDGDVLLSWNSVNNESKWNLKVSSTPIDPATDDADAFTKNGITGAGKGEQIVDELEVGKRYYWYVQTDCGDTQSAWTEERSFLVDAAPATLPFFADFEDGWDGFTVVQDNQVNQWTRGTLPLESAGREGSCLFVSKDGGTSYEFTRATLDRSHFYREIQFPEADEAPNGFELSFDWRCVGDQYNNVMKVYIAPLDVYPAAGEWMPSFATQIGPYFCQKNEWTNTKLELPRTYAGGNYRIVFSWMNNQDAASMQPPAAIDNISVEALTCRTPISLTISDITKTTAQVAWTQEGEDQPSEWMVEYGEMGFELGTGKTKRVTCTTAVIDQLTPGRYHTVYTKSICDEGAESQYSNPIHFASACEPITENYQTGFDDVTHEFFPLCWSSIGKEQRGEVYILDNQIYAHSMPNCIAVNNGAAESSDFVAFVSPELSGIGDMNKRIKFWATIHKPFASLRIGVMSDPSDESTYVELHKINATDLVNPADGTAMMSPFILNLNSPLITDQHKHIVFKHGCEAYMIVLFIDDFVYEAIPDFLEPQNLTLTTLGVDNAILEWEAGSREDEWEYVCGPYGFDPDAADNIQKANTAYAVVKGIQPNVRYEVYVRGVSGEDRSDWAFPVSFTPCVADIIPYSQDFENGHGAITTRSCWNVESHSGSSWFVKKGVSYTGTNSLCVEGSTLDEWVFSSGLTMDRNKTYELSFRYRTFSNTRTDQLKVAVGNLPRSREMDDILDLNDVTQWDYERASVKFTVPTSEIYYIGFYASSQNGSGFSIDDMLITETTPVSIHEIESVDAQVRPNPAKDAISINIDGTADIEIYHSLGTLVKRVSGYQSGEVIYVNDLHPGIYLIKVRQAMDSRTLKVIITD